VESFDHPGGIFWLTLWYILVKPVVSSDYLYGRVIKRFHNGNQKIPQGKSEDTRWVIRKSHSGNQKIPQR
jgi:hypothetical protein